MNLDDMDIRSLHQLYSNKGDNTASWMGRQTYSDSYAPRLGRRFQESLPSLYNAMQPTKNDDLYWQSWENPYMGLMNGALDSTNGFELMKLFLKNRMDVENMKRSKKYGM